MRIPVTAFALALALTARADESRDVLYQISTIDALLSGVYERAATVDEVAAHGDFGLGTFEALDGELIALDGIVYRAAVDGSVKPVPPATGTPFMAVTRFEPDRALSVEKPLDYASFTQWLEAELPSRNIFYAVRVDARFSRISYRSVPRQAKPYPPLQEVVRQQAVFERAGIEGTLIGLWCPAFAKGINVPGFHLHFLSADHSHGGHVLGFSVEEGTVRLDETNGWEVELPEEPAYLKASLEDDRSAELQTVEQGKGYPGTLGK
jgi:acetolactate decarboxylase